MKRNILKMMVLMVLIVFSLYQTTRLWFDDLSDLNLFYDIMNYGTASEEEIVSDRSYFIRPETIAIYSLNGEKEYSLIKKTKLEFDDIFEKSVDILKDIVTKGEIVEEPINPERLWEKRNILFKYPFDIKSNELVEDLKIKDLAFAKNIDQFNEIMITPDSSLEEYVYVYFINNDYNDIKALRIKTNKIEEVNSNLENAIKELEGKEEGFPTFVSSKNLYNDLFENNVLLPEKDLIDSDVVYLKKSKPFYIEEEIDSSQLEHYVNGFFMNNYKWKIEKVEDQWTYSDESVFVNYNTNGVIEYMNDNIDKKKKLTIVGSYYMAEKFLKNDNKINKQEYYLANYQVNGTKIKFNYGYKYNDINMVISPDYLKEFEMEYPMEIIVSDGQVKTYKRLILELDLDEYIKQAEKYNISYNKVLDKFLEKYPDEKSNMQHMFLVYYLPTREEDMTLKWMINDRLFIDEE